MHNSKKTHCKRGHMLSGDNLAYKSNGSRRCRNCHREQERLRYWSSETTRIDSITYALDYQKKNKNAHNEANIGYRLRKKAVLLGVSVEQLSALAKAQNRSEEHTSELQSQSNL